MPELPEVEVVKQGLNQQIRGCRIKAVHLTYAGIVKSDVEIFQTTLVGLTILEVKRRGKYLIFDFGDVAIVSHLRMEGKYFLLKNGESANKHCHVFFELDSGLRLVYQDVRKFGTMEVMATNELPSYFQKKHIGPEPTEEDFLLGPFQKALASSSKKLKPYLLEQSLVAGLGNIYVDEVLFAAKLHPERLSKTLSPLEVKILRKEIIRILQLGIKKGGSTIRTYQNAFGDHGRMQDYHQVYDKLGQPCPRCASPIEKIKVGGRGSHFCPSCQQR